MGKQKIKLQLSAACRENGGLRLCFLYYRILLSKVAYICKEIWPTIVLYCYTQDFVDEQREIPFYL